MANLLSAYTNHLHVSCPGQFASDDVCSLLENVPCNPIEQVLCISEPCDALAGQPFGNTFMSVHPFQALLTDTSQGMRRLNWKGQIKYLSITCRPFRKLEKLECCGNGVGDEGVKELIWLQSLQHLCLGQNPRITDKSSLFLSGLARLRTLNLTGTQLTNNGILPLRALTVSDLFKKLVRLELYGLLLFLKGPTQKSLMTKTS